MVATPSAITAPQRVVASNFFKVVLANVNILAANAQTLAASRLLREALKSRSQRHLRNCMPRNYITGQASHVENSTIQMHHVEGYTDLEWPIDARNRRNVLCACFSHAQTRPEITPYPESARNGIRQTARATPGAPRTARPSKCAISQSKHEPEAACPYTTAENLCTCDCATDRSPIKMHNLERYTGSEWHDHAKTAAAFYTRA